MDQQILQSLTGTFRMFSKDPNYNATIQDAEQLKISVKIADDYAHVKHLPQQQQAAPQVQANNQTPDVFGPAPPAKQQQQAAPSEEPIVSSLVESVVAQQEKQSKKRKREDESKALVLFEDDAKKESTQIVHAEDSALQLIEKRRKLESSLQPQWHPPWKLKRVIAGHMGWVRALAVDPSNDWFASAGTDRTIKIWDLASGVLKLTLTGHASTVRGLAVSDRHPYLFSVGEDKMIKCWDLEQNKSVRQYHGHLSGIYCCALHPTLDILVTGGRDSTVRVWDIRSKAQIFALSGHDNCVASVVCQAYEPQLISGSMDSTVRCWDLAAGKARAVLTNHKKSVRALAIHPTEYAFVSGSPDNIKKWKCPEAQFVHNFTGHHAIINSLAVNSDNVMVSAADNGSMYFWDWKTGYNFFKTQTIPQPGSLDSEAGVFCTRFDMSGTRLITGEADKSIKIWAEDETATQESHPIQFTPNYEAKRY